MLMAALASTTVIAQERASWLPSDKNDITCSKEIDQLLKPLNGSFRPLICQYNENLLVSRNEIGENGLQTGASAQWTYDLKAMPVKGEGEALDLAFTFRHTGGEAVSAGIALAFDFRDWSPENYVMIPASVYNGNRNRIVDREYAEGLDRSDLYRADLPQTTTAVPQLSPNPGEVSRLEVHTSNTTTPGICFFSPGKKQGFIVLTEQGIEQDGQIIDNGFIVEENTDRTVATLAVSAPGVREKKPEFIGFSKSPDRGITWKDGEERTIRLRVYVFRANGITDLLDQFAKVRKSVTGPNTPRNLIPMSETLRLMAIDIDKRYYQDEQYQFYCPENADWISYGWIGGMMNTFPMLALGDDMHRERVKHTYDFGLTLGQGKAGYYWGALNHDGKPFGREGYDDHPEITLTRKNADVLFWMVKQLTLFKELGYGDEIKPDWEKRIQHLADAFVKTWNEYGQWGNFVNHDNGSIAVYNTTSGVMAIGGLALASEYYGEQQYMQVATQAADYYYNEFTRWGMTTGACADILQNSDSESAAAFMTSLMTLYEMTGQEKWLLQSRDLANLCATWTTSFDYRLPADTPLAKLGAKLTGAVWASTQNKHGAPGFCTLSGDALFKIYRTTGETLYAELMRDIVHAHAEGIQPNGHITERLTYCDADSRGSRGDGGKTGWNETNGAMMALEIPGIYVRTDIDRFVVFDHMEAEVLKRENGRVLLRITNPTPHDASVCILAENKAQAEQPLGTMAFLRWPAVLIESGTSIEDWFD